MPNLWWSISSSCNRHCPICGGCCWGGGDCGGGGAGGDLFADVTSAKNQLNSVQNEGFHNSKNGSHQESSCQAPGAWSSSSTNTSNSGSSSSCCCNNIRISSRSEAVAVAVVVVVILLIVVIIVVVVGIAQSVVVY